MANPEKYTATISGASWAVGPTARFPTIRACRDWAEDYGTTADRCEIECGGTIVGMHARDTSGNGMRWFRAAI